MNEPSERMRGLMAALEASTIAGHDMHVNALLSAIAELEQRAAVSDGVPALLRDAHDDLKAQSARAEKAEAERDILLQQPDNRLDGYRELGAKCAALEERNDALKAKHDKWKRVAVAQERVRQMRFSSDAETSRVFAEMDAAIEDLGDEWTEAVK